MKLDQCPVTSDEKQRMVAEAAYFRFAEQEFYRGRSGRGLGHCRSGHRKFPEGFLQRETAKKGAGRLPAIRVFETVEKWFHRLTSWAKSQKKPVLSVGRR